jgi:hypothetical protein
VFFISSPYTTSSNIQSKVPKIEQFVHEGISRKTFGDVPKNSAGNLR